MKKDKSLEEFMFAWEKAVAWVRAHQTELGEPARQFLRETDRDEVSLASVRSEVRSMLALIRREQLVLGESEMGALRDLDLRLRIQSEAWHSDPQDLDLDLCALLEEHANLYRVFFAVIDLEMAEECVEGLDTFEKLACERDLSEEERKRMGAVEAALERARERIHRHLGPLRAPKSL